ncbi:hypothetical protein ACFL1X_08570 [Candidatus Hydrogenedentota bacterium]
MAEVNCVEASIKRVGSITPHILGKAPVILLGTVKSHPTLGELRDKKAFKEETGTDGYSMKTILSPFGSLHRALAVCGTNDRGALYAVRDLCHYHLVGKPRGSFRLPKLELKVAPAHVRRGTFSWDYYVSDPYKYIDRLSDWKQNVVGIVGFPYLLEQPEIFDYAEERGVDVYIGMGIFSWEFTQIAVHRQTAWLPDPPPSYVKRSPDGRVICPSDKRSREWQVGRILDILRAMPKIKGFLFQTGILDFPDCTCGNCQKLKSDELYLKMAQPVMEAVLKERPDMFMCHSIGKGEVYNKQFRKALKHIDQRSQLMIETATLSTDEDVDMAMKHHFEGGKLINHVKVYEQINNGYLLDRWRYCRRQTFHDVYNGLERCVEEYGSDTALSLVQSRIYGEKDILEPAFYGEAAWHAGRTPEKKFMKTVVPRLREICDHDVRYSDPPTTHFAEGKTVSYHKRMIGTYDDWGWIWGQVRICTPLVAPHCDLLVESDTAEYNFELRRSVGKGLKSAELIVRGAIAADVSEKACQRNAEDDTAEDKKRYTKSAKPPYKFDIDVNGHLKRNVMSSWKRGVRRMGMGSLFTAKKGRGRVTESLNKLEGISDWTVKLNPAWIKSGTKVKLTLHDDGLVMYEKMTLKLEYR